jgi:pimeloyl-ACP methyl ester carboxylesterase
MRRPVLVLIAALLAAAALAGAPAGARAAHWEWSVRSGTAHKGAGGRLVGNVVVANTGNARSPRAEGELRMKSGGQFERPALPSVPPIAPGQSVRLRFRPKAPRAYAHQLWSVSFCVKQRCGKLGKVEIGGRPAPEGSTTTGAGGGGAGGAPGKGSGPGGSAPTGPKAPVSTVPTAPIPYKAGTPFEHSGGGAEYWAYVPRSYDGSGQTPSTLFVWMHGCEGQAGGDIWNVDPEAGGEGKQDWLTVSLAGREEPGNECWNPGADQNAVLAAIADFETHFNIDRRRVILGGYSSGGDLAYRTAWEHTTLFAGLLIENSAPFRDTGLTQSQALAAATWKLPVVQLAHTGDETYGIEEVQSEVNALAQAGFPVTLIERPGKHYDSHTNGDLRKLLLPYIDAGWLAPTP